MAPWWIEVHKVSAVRSKCDPETWAIIGSNRMPRSISIALVLIALAIASDATAATVHGVPLPRGSRSVEPSLFETQAQTSSSGKQVDRYRAFGSLGHDASFTLT